MRTSYVVRCPHCDKHRSKRFSSRGAARTEATKLAVRHGAMVPDHLRGRLFSLNENVNDTYIEIAHYPST